MSRTSASLARMLEFGEAAVWLDWFQSLPTGLANLYGAHIRRIGSAAALTIARMGVPFYSRVIGLGLAEPATETMLEELAIFCQQARCSQITVTLSPQARPAALQGWLGRWGFSPGESWAKVYRGAAPPPDVPTDFRIACAGPEHAAAFARLACTNFEMPEEMIPLVAASVGRPGWRHYLAWDGETPVATGALFLRDGLGWLGFGTTLASHRRRGAQGAVMARRIRDGLALGCRQFICETTAETPAHPNPSYHNMLRLGFRLAYLRSDYVCGAFVV
jgi:hypothetical protein